MASVAFLLSALLILLSKTAIADSNLTLICKPLKDQAFCLQTLQSDPRSLKSDVPGLAMIATEFAVSNATASLFYLAWLLKDAGEDDKLKEAILTCGKSYSAAAQGLGKTLMDLGGRSYEEAFYRRQPREEPGRCKEAFREGGVGFPAEVGRRGEAVERLCDLVHEIIYWYLKDLS